MEDFKTQSTNRVLLRPISTPRTYLEEALSNTQIRLERFESVFARVRGLCAEPEEISKLLVMGTEQVMPKIGFTERQCHKPRPFVLLEALRHSTFGYFDNKPNLNRALGYFSLTQA